MSSKKRILKRCYIPNGHQMILIYLFFVDVVDRVLSYLVLQGRRVIPRVVRKTFFLSSFSSLNDVDVNINGSTERYVRIVFVLSMSKYTNREEKKEGNTLFFSLPREKKTFDVVCGVYKRNLRAIFMRKENNWDQAEILMRKKNAEDEYIEREGVLV